VILLAWWPQVERSETAWDGSVYFFANDVALLKYRRARTPDNHCP
jgi:hypothetical protein